MAKKQNTLGDSKSEVVEEEFLKENPKGMPDKHGLVVARDIPEMKKITFINERDPGKALEFHYASGTHPLKHYTLYHGYDYTLTQEVIDHLENCAEKIYGYRKSEQGKPEMYTKSLKYIFRCKPAKAA